MLFQGAGFTVESDGLWERLCSAFCLFLPLD